MNNLRDVLGILDRAAAAAMLVIGMLFSAFCLFLGSAAIANEDRLASKGIGTTAAVTATRRETGGSGGLGYELQYEFQVASGGARYSYSDELGRRNLWYAASSAEWEIAQSTGRIRVLYLPENPWVNRPLDESPVGDAIAAIVMGWMAASLCAMGAYGYIRRRLRMRWYARTVPPDTVDVIVHFLRRVQTEGGGRNCVWFTLGDSVDPWIQCRGGTGDSFVYAEAAEKTLSHKQLSQLRYLGWSRPNLWHRDHHHRHFRAATDADRRMIAFCLLQTFHEIYGLPLNLTIHAHLVMDEDVR